MSAARDYSPADVYLTAIKAGYSVDAANDIAELVRGTSAQAWDEGRRGVDPVNPYRAEADRG
jgi:hypothetical protein